MLLLLWTTPSYMEIVNYVFRFIVLVEVFQNAWSLSAVTNGRQGTTLLRQVQWDQISGPWRTKDHHDEHRLEDVFLEDETFSTDDEEDEQDHHHNKKYHHYHFDEGTFILNEILDGGEILDRGLELDENYNSLMP